MQKEKTKAITNANANVCAIKNLQKPVSRDFSQLYITAPVVTVLRSFVTFPADSND